MKKIVIYFMFCMPLVAAAQQTLRLDSCLFMAERNYPLLNKAELLHQTEELNNKISSISYYPSLKINAQFNWQTEVTHIDIDNPMFSGFFPEISKDQYKVFAELSQTIWDGGIVSAKKELERAAVMAGLSQIEAEIFTHKEKLVSIYFGALAMQKQMEILEMKSDQLQNVISDLRVAKANNIVMQSQIDVLLAEKMILEQNITELEYEIAYFVKLLSVYCGTEFDRNITFLTPTPEISPGKEVRRPELAYFESQKQQIMAGQSIINTSRMPKVFAFAQAGYGRPGLNMLSNDFEPFAIVGAKLVWTPWEWNKSKYELQLLEVKSSLINNAQENYMLHQNALLEAQLQKIEKINRLSENDRELLELRESITKAYLIQMNEGVLKSSDYLNALNDENAQRLTIELHQLMMAEAVVKYNLIKGEIYGDKRSNF
jgi:outer membrane protein TolC